MRTAILNHSFWAFVVPVVIILTLFVQFRISGEDWKYVVDSDGRGYYHYLVEYFIDDEFRDTAKEKSYLAELDGVHYNRYTLGTALLLSPFFGLGYVIAVIGDYPPDGFSLPFQLMTGLGAVFYLIFGGWMLFRLMLSYRCSKNQAWIISLFTVFGTNLLYYGVIGSTMSHVYSFAAIATLSLITRKFFLSGKDKHLILAGVIFGLVVLIRPFNGLVILCLPLFFIDSMPWKVALQRISNSWVYVLLAGAISLLLFVPQVIAWHNQTGIWMLYGYSKMGFYFSNPQVLEVLLGFNKGLFIYTPLLLSAIIASVVCVKRNPHLTLWFLSFFVLLTYIISSWWCWNYASGFGMRPFIDYYAVFAIPVGHTVGRFAGRKLRWLMFPAVLLTLLNLVQTYQYDARILHPNNMDFEKYKYTFLKTGEPYQESLGGNFDLPPYSKSPLQLIAQFDTLPGANILEEEFAFTRQFDAGLLPGTSGFLHWKIELSKSDMIMGASNQLYFVVEYSVGDSTTLYGAFKINDLPDYPVSKKVSHQHSLTMRVPDSEESIKFYLWNKGLNPIRIEEYSTTIWATSRATNN